MKGKKTYIVQIERSDTLRFLVDANSEEEAENIIYGYANRGALDSITVDREPEYGRAECLVEVDVVIKDKED